MMWQQSFYIFMHAVKPSLVLLLHLMRAYIINSLVALCMKKLLINTMPLQRHYMICNNLVRWIVWSAVMLVLVKLKWRCEPLLSLHKMKNKWRYLCQRLCLHSNTMNRLKIVLLIRRFASKCYHALARINHIKKSLPIFSMEKWIL